MSYGVMHSTNVYYSTKTYGYDRGFSCAFRQWKASSHCNLIHGYSLGFKFIFSTSNLDERNWVVDFGDFKDLKNKLEYYFDHTTLVAKDDPELDLFKEMEERKIIRLIILDRVGCESVAEFVYGLAEEWLEEKGYSPRCAVNSVEVAEHGSNSAIFKKNKVWTSV